MLENAGHAKEKDTLIMPRPMVDALSEHVREKCLDFLPLKDNCTSDEDQRRLAKYLGKYPREGRAE